MTSKIWGIKFTYTLVLEEGGQRNTGQAHVVEDLNDLTGRTSSQQDCKRKKKISCWDFGTRHVWLAVPNFFFLWALWVLAPGCNNCHGSHFTTFNQGLVGLASMTELEQKEKLGKKTQCVWTPLADYHLVTQKKKKRNERK